MKRKIFALVILVFAVSAFSQEMERKQTSLTIYNQNFALVRDVRLVTLKDGLNILKCSDIAAMVEPASVSFKSITAPDNCLIVEQNFEYDLVNTDKLLKKYIDRNIKIITKDNNIYTGYLSSYDAGYLVLNQQQETGPVFMVNRENIRNIEFPQIRSHNKADTCLECLKLKARSASY